MQSSVTAVPYAAEIAREQTSPASTLPETENELELDDADLEHVTGGLARIWTGDGIAPLATTP